MKGERKAISKRTRFEVFKRDQFKCQYCGGSAPDVLLTLDHIKPVNDGGTNDLMNLVSACDGCNSGKAAVPLSDDSAVKRQLAQARALADRREQLEMLMQWRDGLTALDDEMVRILIGKVNARLAPKELTEIGESRVRTWLKKFGFDSSLYGINQAHAGEGGELLKQMEQFSAAAAKVAKEPELRDFWRIRLRLRSRRFRYGQEWVPIQDMRRAFAKGWSIADMDAAVQEAENYDHFLALIGYKR